MEKRRQSASHPAGEDSESGDGPGAGSLRALLRHPAAHLLVITALVLVGYGAAIGRDFVSLDFLLLARLDRGGFWETFHEQLTGPCLGIAYAPFYRPVSTILLQLEQLAFGVRPLPFMVVHLGLHLVNVALVYRIARRLWGRDDRVVAMAAATIFALYPLHPNTTVFVASYATLFATTFCLGAFAARMRGARGIALVLYALALGSYEQAVIMPALFLLQDLLAPRGASGRRPLVWREHLATGAVTVLYLVLRQSVLGSVIGGYAAIRAKMGVALLDAARDFLVCLGTLVVPTYGGPPGEVLFYLTSVVFVAGSLVALIRLRRGSDAARWWLLGAVWIIVTQAPFLYPAVSPANGRYWYLSAIGVAWLAIATGMGLGRCLKSTRRALVLAPAFVLVAVYVLLLRDYSVQYVGAARLATSLRSTAAELPVEAGEPLFLGGHPDFVNDAGGYPVAQVYAWGLSSALRPPFLSREARAYPLPPLELAALRPVLDHPSATTAWWWETEWFHPPAPQPPAPSRIELEVQDDGRRFAFRSPAGRHQLVFVSRVNSKIIPLAGRRDDEGWLRAELPAELVELERHLFGDAIFWWVIGRDAGGALVALSPLKHIDPLPG